MARFDVEVPRRGASAKWPAVWQNDKPTNRNGTDDGTGKGYLSSVIPEQRVDSKGEIVLTPDRVHPLDIPFTQAIQSVSR
ncbi:MAG TPA: hypothetical protein VIE89_13215 [Candidatus Binatia bacterium]|jgi:hypothetical protein